MTPRRNWDSPNPSLASECTLPPRTWGGTLACGWGVGGVPILTTLEKKLSTLPTLWMGPMDLSLLIFVGVGSKRIHVSLIGELWRNKGLRDERDAIGRLFCLFSPSTSTDINMFWLLQSTGVVVLYVGKECGTCTKTWGAGPYGGAGRGGAIGGAGRGPTQAHCDVKGSPLGLLHPFTAFVTVWLRGEGEEGRYSYVAVLQI